MGKINQADGRTDGQAEWGEQQKSSSAKSGRPDKNERGKKRKKGKKDEILITLSRRAINISVI